MRAPRPLLVLAAALIGVYAATTLTHPGEEAQEAKWLYLAALAACLACVLLRAVAEPRERAAWACFAAGIACWVTGDTIWLVHYTPMASPPFPSVADPFYLALGPFAYAGIILLLRARFGRVPGRLWLDGPIGGLALAAAGAAVLFPAVLTRTGADPLMIATNLAYPVGDVLLLSVALGVCVVAGRGAGATWLLLAAGLALFAVIDLSYLHRTTVGTYEEHTLLDAGWPAGLWLIAAAAWQRPVAGAAERLSRWAVAAVPTASGLVVLALVVLDHFSRIPDGALLLAAACGVLLLARMALTLVDHTRMLETVRSQAATDALTGLGNRRALMDDLERAIAARAPGEELVLALLDLDGFKAFNDTFGHPAGDALLARMGRDLAAAVARDGRAYRLGGDEFCLVLDGAGVPRALAAAESALFEHRDAVRVGASLGTVRLPAEATDTSAAIRLADQRLYASKAARHAAGLRAGSRRTATG